MRIKPGAIVIPFLSAADSLQQDPVIINWIRKHYSVQVNVLSVCDGSATAAATGIFDGKPITAHASDFAGIRPSLINLCGFRMYAQLMKETFILPQAFPMLLKKASW